MIKTIQGQRTERPLSRVVKLVKIFHKHGQRKKEEDAALPCNWKRMLQYL